MALDRDLHVAVTAALAEERGPFESGWEMLAATGVRGLRVLRESGALRRLLSTDGGEAASVVLAENASRYATYGARARRWDSRRPLEGETFDWVDLDPFGSPLPFLPAALDAVRDGGLLSVTATDMLVLAGVQRGASERRYGAAPVRGRLGPEAGLRIVLKVLAEQAAARGRRVRPRLAYLRDHYVRAYVTLSKDTLPEGSLGTIDPETWPGPPLLAAGIVGPLWLGPLFDADVVARLKVPPTAARPKDLGELIVRLTEETSADVPFYYESNSVAHATSLSNPPPVDAFLTALRTSGRHAARSHARDGAFRTDAPRSEVYGVAQRWAVDSGNPSGRKFPASGEVPENERRPLRQELPPGPGRAPPHRNGPASGSQTLGTRAAIGLSPRTRESSRTSARP